MTRQKNTPAAATAQGKTNELQNYYNNTVDGLQAKIVDKLNRITDIHALNRIYDCVYRQFLKAGTETTRDFTSVTLQIEDGVTMLEAAADAYGVLSDASAGLLIYTTEANYQYQQDKTAQSRIERINQNRRELAAALH